MRKEISTEESIARILATRLGERVMRPEFGSNLHELIDKSATDEWKLLAMDYTAEAIEKNEPRAELQSVRIATGERVEIVIEYKENEESKIVRVAV